MKKLLFTVLLLAVLLVTMAAAAPIIYNLDTEAGISSFVSSKQGISISYSDGFMSFTTENADPQFQHNFKADAFTVDTHPYIKYRYKLDKVDGATGCDRQRYAFDKVVEVLDTEFVFEDKESARSWFQSLRQKFIDWNYEEFGSEDFKNLESALDEQIRKQVKNA